MEDKGAKGERVKTKVRFTSLDVAAMVAELQALVGLRVSNIYDLTPTTYIFKIAKSEEKHQLLIENGVRFHLTSQKPDKKTIPSGFTMKFRKFLRSKRVEGVRQVGVQRVVVLSFGSESFSNHLILELYSQGNIILTDHNYRIIQCIRSHEFKEGVKTAVGQIYPFEHAANIYLENIDVSWEAAEKHLVRFNDQQAPTKKKGKGGNKVKDIVFKLIPCLFPAVIESLLIEGGMDPEGKTQGEEGKALLLKASEHCLGFLKGYIGKKHKGYLYTKGQDYFQFSAYPNCKLSKYPCVETVAFGAAVADYFANYKKGAHDEEEAFEELAWRKYQQIKRDQSDRMRRLVEQQQTYGGKAKLIEQNVEQVDAVLQIIGTMENNGFSWEQMERMVGESRKTGDPLANMIHDFNAPKRQITVLLGDKEEESDLAALIPVELMVDYNGYTNAEMYYSSRKKQQQKEQRTKEASEQVLKIAEKDALKKIEKKKNQMLIKAVPSRKQMWFQKFYWFASSEGWLVISGRDSHQNELLVKRYMRAGDLYMHSDYGGAASTIIKGPPGIKVAPRITLQEAAIFTVCRSKAWDTKIISSAWWVYHDQVSKSAPTGEFLPTGSFMIRGKRNFVHPNRMEMGFTLLYRLDNESMLKRIEKQKLVLSQRLSEEEPMIRQTMKEDDQFAIIDLEAEARKAREEKKERLQKGKGKQTVPEQLKKQSSVTQQQKVEESDEENSDDSEDEKDYGKKGAKKEQKKDNKRGKQQQQQEEPQQKHKNRNKKKLKKLEKYMEEQDEEERQLIMKMIGAKEMKHRREQEQEESAPKKQSKQPKKQQKKKGMDKFFNMAQEDEKSIDTDKVLFLKEKNKKEQQPLKEEPKQPVIIEEATQEQRQESRLQAEEQNEQEIAKENEKKDDEILEEPTPQSADENNEEKPQEGEKQQEEQKKEGAQEQEEAAESQEEPEPEEKQQQEKPEDQVDQKQLDSELAQLPRLATRLGGTESWDALVPMCAPYPTIKDNTFKIKLVPGGLKKGKAARNVANYFASGALQENEKAFIRALPQQELINAIIGNVKLAGAGLLKLEQKSKAEKKEKRKEQDRKKEG